MLYPNFNVKNNNTRKEYILWDIPKNTEVDVKWVQKKEELRKETRKNNT